MDFSTPDGLSSSYRSRVKKAQRDAIQAEHQKQQKYLNKCEAVCGRAQKKEEEQFRKKLEKLEQTKSSLDVDGSNQSLKRSSKASLADASQDLAHTARLHSNQILNERIHSSRDLSKFRELEKKRTRSIRQLAEDYKNCPEDNSTAPAGIAQKKSTHDSGARPKVSFDSRGNAGSSKEGRRMSLQTGRDNVKQGSEHKRRLSLPAKSVARKKSSECDSSVPSIVLTEDQVDSTTVLFLSPDKKPELSIHDKTSTNSLGSPKSSRQLDQTKRKPLTESDDSKHRSSQSLEKDLNNLYEMAIQTVASADETTFSSLPNSRASSSVFSPKHSTSKIPDAKQMDLATLKELEKLLEEARHFKDRKTKEEEQHGHASHSSRMQKRRLEFLEEILHSLNKTTNVEIDPKEMLECTYLRLSKSNIESLEQMIRESGRDPGIHAHTDVTNYNIWKNLDVERKESTASSGKRSSHQGLNIKYKKN